MTASPSTTTAPPSQPPIEVWQIALDAPRPAHEQARATLPDVALARANAFQNESTRQRHILAHAALHWLLAKRLKCNPHEIVFEFGPQGKPALPSTPFHFNLSHSGDLALVAISETIEVGVDVERIRPVRDPLALAERFFTPGEHAELEGMPPQMRLDCFFRLWTQKEALLKATGQGIANGLKHFEVTSRDGGGLARMDGTTASTATWTLFNWIPRVGYVSACAVPISNATVIKNHFHFPAA
jgi:4'-phosphopantetheinyl transferase